MRNLIPIFLAVVVLSSGCDNEGYSCTSEGCYADDSNPQYLSLEDCQSVCDENDDPIVPSQGNYLFDIYGPPPMLSVTEQKGKNVLLEDFTAHQCGNCPAATGTAINILYDYPGRVFLIGIHAGALASTSSEFPTDWTCEEGDFFWNQLDFQANPVGRINRTGGPGNGFFLDQWEDLAEGELQVETPVELQIETSWHPNLGHLNIHIHGQYYNNSTGDHRLSILITESNLIGNQLEYISNLEHIIDYEFNHLLRGSISGPEGFVAISNAQEGDHFQADFTYNWNAEWMIENCEIIAILSDEDGYILNCLGIHPTN